MKGSSAEALVMAARELGIDAEIRENYSGRGMNGETTCAVVLDYLDRLPAIAAHAAMEIEHMEEDASDLVEDLMQLRHDALGRETIVY